MRIGLFTDTYVPDINGVANSTFILFTELRRAGHDVFVVAPKHGLGLAEWDEDHTVLHLAGMTIKALYGYAVTTPIHAHAFNLIKDLDLDVIHVQTEFGVGIFARFCARMLEIPLVSTYHTTYEDYTHYANFFDSRTFDEYARKLVARLSRIYGDSSIEVIAPSEKTKELLERYHVHTKINVIPTGLDLQKFRPENQDRTISAELRKEFGFRETDTVFVYVGRIAEEKSVEMIIDGFALAAAKRDDIKLLIVGDGPDYERMKAKAEGMPAIVLAGSRPIDTIHHYYAASDAFISASLSETQGITFIEALASGIPILVRRDEALASLVKEGRSGWYFSSPEELANAVVRFASTDVQERSRIASWCTECASPYSKESFCRDVLEVYREAIWLYENMSRITAVNIRSDTVILTLEDKKGVKGTVSVTLDDYVKEGLKAGRTLTKKHVEDLKNREQYVKAYQACLRRLSVKDRSRYELFDWMRTHTECTSAEMNRILDTLEEKGLVNDRQYCENAVNSLRASLTGREKILRNLRRKGISQDVIEDVLATENDELYAKAFAEKAAASIHDQSLMRKKQKIVERMVAKGYDLSTAKDSVEQLDLQEDEENQDEYLRKCIAKAMKRLQKKQSGDALKRAVFRYCMTQGFRSEDIHRILEETEWPEYDED